MDHRSACPHLSHAATIVDTGGDLTQTMMVLFLMKEELMRRTHLLAVLVTILLVAGLLGAALSSTTVKLLSLIHI